MDDLLNLTLAEYKQVVILEVGLDTRAYRMASAHSTTVYEVDCPELLQYKAQVLQDI